MTSFTLSRDASRLIFSGSDFDAFWVVGLAYQGPMKAAEAIPRLWQTFNKRMGNVKNRAQEGVAFGVFYSTPDQLKKSEMTYMAAVPVSDPSGVRPRAGVPQDPGWTICDDQTYGPISKITNSLDFLFRTWVSDSDYALENRENFEVTTRWAGNC